MNIAIRLFLGYFLIVGVAAWFVVNIFAREVEPGVRQATEDTLVDTANLLAELAVDELAAGKIGQGGFAAAVRNAQLREPQASIWGVSKESVDFRVYLTDARGIVVYDSEGVAVNADYSQWRDVARVLHGEYGARSTREDPADPESSVMYVAAPVLRQGALIGVLTVAKPMTALTPYVERARDRVRRAGFVLLGVSAVIGLLFTLWLTWSLNRLRDYARSVANGDKVLPPTVGGRQLSELARALALMRERLDGKQYVENYVQSLAHEMKSPLTAVRGAAELLQEDPSVADRQRFARSIVEQAERMQLIIERLLALARIEQLQAPEEIRDIALGDLAREALAGRAEQLAARGITARIGGELAAQVRGDPFLLQQAVGNLLDNAIEFSSDGAGIEIDIGGDGAHHVVSVRDHGPGAPDFALPHLFERFYSLPRPATGRKSTGLGLAFVREVAKLHGGRVEFANAVDGGAVARLALSL
ncbi:MAG: two-component system sensor histidine kinase CreC [Rhodocyclales bacterium RIFCSPLOWO2_02_FULL_63_24]|nr:MAG: two-component system sensor histidine kinase CreC [Rhodocyclales bacterium GWA2_65_19]OHC67919.1 MAG: two-component system sensor histidine kinase CreC [Rhodocyclales bacterium RIFCSPLOWO2_02_FULL_63_24]